MYKFFLSSIIYFLIFTIVLAEDLTSSNFILRNPVVDAGGVAATSTSFQSFDFTGQTDVGESTSTSFQNQAGFGYTPDTQFTLSAPTSTAFNSIAVSNSSQTTTSTLSNLNVIDSRGTAPGWSASVTATNLTLVSVSSTLAGSNSTDWTGTYTGVSATSTSAIYTVEITTGGAVGTAVFKWTDSAGVITLGVTTAGTVVLNNGVSVKFPSATFSVGDKWRLNVDSMSYNDLTLTPGSITVNSGSGTGVTAGSSGIFSGSGTTSNARTLMSATAGNGEGNFSQNPLFNLNVHANNLQGNFRGTITITLA